MERRTSSSDVITRAYMGSLLVEVGGHGNTLEEAVEGGKLFARTVGAALQEMG